MFLLCAAGAERQQDIRWSGGAGGAAGQSLIPELEREQVQRPQHPGASGGLASKHEQNACVKVVHVALLLLLFSLAMMMMNTGAFHAPFYVLEWTNAKF